MVREIESLSGRHAGNRFKGLMPDVASGADVDSTRHIWNAWSVDTRRVDGANDWRRAQIVVQIALATCVAHACAFRGGA